MKRTICFENPVILSTKNKQLIIKNEKNEFIDSIPIEDIGVVVFEHRNIIINNETISNLQDNNVSIVFCDEKHMPKSLLLPIEGNHIQQERYEIQICSSEALKNKLWKQIIENKINNQAILLESVGKENLFLEKIKSDIISGDKTNCEGMAAVHYWKNIFKEDVEKFKRERFGDAPNHLLNYGYSILRATMARSVVSAGLLPSLGLFHKNRYNAFCLVDDLMEPYRPYVDRIVYNLIKIHGVQKELTKEYKTELLKIPALEIKIKNKKTPLMFATEQTATSLVDCFKKTKTKILFPNFK